MYFSFGVSRAAAAAGSSCGSYLRDLLVPHEERFLAEGVHQHHPTVAVVAIGGGTRLRQVVLGQRQEKQGEQFAPLIFHEHMGHLAQSGGNEASVSACLVTQ